MYKHANEDQRISRPSSDKTNTAKQGQKDPASDKVIKMIWLANFRL